MIAALTEHIGLLKVVSLELIWLGVAMVFTGILGLATVGNRKAQAALNGALIAEFIGFAAIIVWTIVAR